MPDQDVLVSHELPMSRQRANDCPSAELPLLQLRQAADVQKAAREHISPKVLHHHVRSSGQYREVRSALVQRRQRTTKIHGVDEDALLRAHAPGAAACTAASVSPATTCGP